MEAFREQLGYFFVGVGVLLCMMAFMGIVALVIWGIATWPWATLIPLGIVFLWWIGRDVSMTDEERYPF